MSTRTSDAPSRAPRVREPDPAAFPAGFLLGVATSSYQIEGATDDDGRGPSIWDAFAAEPGKVIGGVGGQVACDHYHRLEGDLDLIASLGVDAYRFSVAWPRIQPEGRGRPLEAGLDFYERLVDGLLERGIAPFCTLYHWDLPLALEEAGGWPERDTAHRFADYAEIVASRLGDRVRSYATLNEPWCSAYLGYEVGVHAPGRTDRRAALQASHHLLLGHGLAMPRIRAVAPGSEHGIVLNFSPADPAGAAPEDGAAADRHETFFHRWYLEPLLLGAYPEAALEGYGDDAPEVADGDLDAMRAPLDFLGVNFYNRAVIAAGDGPWPATRHLLPPDAPVTDMGWEVRPESLRDLLTDLHERYGDALPPLYITENGAAYPDPDTAPAGGVDDPERTAYLRGHVAAVQEAIARGVDVRGYFAWSLMDNFEWAEGYAKRFGIVHVDYDTQERTPKASALWFRDLARARQVDRGA